MPNENSILLAAFLETDLRHEFEADNDLEKIMYGALFGMSTAGPNRNVI